MKTLVDFKKQFTFSNIKKSRQQSFPLTKNNNKPYQKFYFYDQPFLSFFELIRMNEKYPVYKRYTKQKKTNAIFMLKHQQIQSYQKQISPEKPSKNENPLKDNVMFKSLDEKSLQPVVLKKFQEYFKKTIEPGKNVRIFNEFIHHQNLKGNLSRRNQKYSAMSPVNFAKLITNDTRFVQNIIGKEVNNVQSSISKYRKFKQTITRTDIKIPIVSERTIEDSQIAPITPKPIHILNPGSRKRQRLNLSVNLSMDLNQIFNKTFTQINSKTIIKQLSTLVSKNQDTDAQGFDLLKIQSSTLVDRKLEESQLNSPKNKKTVREEQLKKSIRTKLVNRKRGLQESYNDRLRSRSPSPSRHSRKVNFLNFIKPIGKPQFTLVDLMKVSMVNSMVDGVKMNMNGCFFSVYVQQGNNSDLIKSIVRGISGWRVAELPEVANLVWTQNHRRNLIKKKPRKIVRDQPQEEQNRSPQSRQRSQQRSKDNQSFLISRAFQRKNSGSSELLRRKSQQKVQSHESQHKISPLQPSRNYPQLSLLKYQSQELYHSYEKEIRKLLPEQFQVEQYVVKSEKQAARLTINPNFLIHNHLIGHRAISDKKNLLFNLRKFYLSQNLNPFNYIPESHDISSINDEFILKQTELIAINHQSSEIIKKQIWIVKPGEDSNRGRGIVICKGWESVIVEIGKRLKQTKSQNNKPQQQPAQTSNRNQASKEQTCQKPSPLNPTPPKTRTTILQRYITPLLYNGRKFDIRSYMLLTWVNNTLNAYVYEECYIRTSSKQFDIDSENKYVHLTNDAIQCMSHQYGKYEEGNKVSEMVFAKYFDGLTRKDSKCWSDVKQEMTSRCKDIIKSASKKLVGKPGHARQSMTKDTLRFNADSFLLNRSTSISPQNKPEKTSSLFSSLKPVQKQTEMSFQLFGLDFMIDNNSRTWLIEVNTNPAITNDCSRVLQRLIPKLLDNTFAIAVMPYMRPSRIPQNVQCHNQFRHIYQEVIKEQVG